VGLGAGGEAWTLPFLAKILGVWRLLLRRVLAGRMGAAKAGVMCLV